MTAFPHSPQLPIYSEVMGSIPAPANVTKSRKTIVLGVVRCLNNHKRLDGEKLALFKKKDILNRFIRRSSGSSECL